MNRPIKKSKRKEIYVVACFFVIIFVGMIAYLINFVTNGAKEFVYNPYNSRFSVFADDVTRGNIYTADGHAIAQTSLGEDRKEVRVYPDKKLFCHSVGYVDKGMTGLEASYSFDLLKSNIPLEEQINNSLTGKKSPGDDLFTTLDYDTQKAAYDGLDIFDGAVIAMEPDTGKIVAMVSKPDFDPNTIAANWDDLTDEKNKKSSLVNRATLGAYPPGSTFKIVTTIAYLRANGGNEDYSFNCKGSLKVDDYKIHCSGHKSHGKEDLLKAFSNSCNSAFADIGLNIDPVDFRGTAESLLFNQELPTMLEHTKASSFKVNSSTAKSIIAQSAIGQGETSASPLHMCMLVSAIANDGNLMEPYLADKIITAKGETVQQTKPKSYGDIISKDEASKLQSYMEAVVMDGTADKVDFGDLKVYGKTGTAEFTNNKNQTHSWFVGYAVDNSGKKLAVAVIMERAGYGSKYAAPLAAKVFKAYFE
ncbi:MAG: penicillin-binding protein 2 [Pseudobutyrivibrio sp.]|nr:penicillin-binding protein 2 [Pseudobutyrivibrio sp.]